MSLSAKIFLGSSLFVCCLLLVIVPAISFAQVDTGLVPCGTETDSSGVVTNPCNFGHFFTLITNVTNYLIILGTAFSAIAFGWAGFLMMTAGGEMSKIEQGKAIFGKVLVGFLIMLSAWLIVHAINAGLIAPGYFTSSGVDAI